MVRTAEQKKLKEEVAKMLKEKGSGGDSENARNADGTPVKEVEGISGEVYGDNDAIFTTPERPI
jgi:hypothetical protein